MTGGARLGYVVSMFPRLSETFILNEVLELERLGYDLTIFPRKPDGGGPRHGEIDRVRSRVDPVCVTRPRDWFPTLSDHLRVFAGAPRLYLRTLQGVLRRRRWPAFRKFLVAGRVARRVRGRRLTHLHAHFAADNAKIARLAARLTGVPFSFTAHAKDIWVKTPPASLRKLLGAARFAVTICRYNREYLSRLDQSFCMIAESNMPGGFPRGR